MTYQIGIGVSLFLSILVTATLGFTYAIRQPWMNNSKNLPINGLYKYSAIGFTIAVFVFFSSFNLIFSIVNGYYNFSTNRNDLTMNIFNEIKSGVFAQRLTSISLGISFLVSVIKFSKHTPFPNDEKKAEYLVFSEALKYDVNYKAKMNSYEFNFLGITQQAFYVFILSLLWLMTIKSGEFNGEIAPMLLAYALFYIVDDWTIIFKHSVILKGNFLKNYNIWIWILNLAIIILGLFCLKDNYLYMITFLILAIVILSYRLRIEFSDLFGQRGRYRRT